MTSDKSYATEARVNHALNAAGLVNPGTGGGGNGQRKTIILTANQSIVSTTPVIVGANSVPMTWTVVAGSYLIDGTIVAVIGAVATQPRFRFAGPAESLMLIPYWVTYESGTGESAFAGNLSGLAVNTTSPSSAIPIGAASHTRFAGTITFSAGGSFSVQSAEATASDPFTISAGSYATLETVGQTS